MTAAPTKTRGMLDWLEKQANGAGGGK